MRKKRPSASINAGSMADIAFLLLIFFLVSTQILNDKGVKVLLPEYSENVQGGKVPGKILKILINYKNQLMVNEVPQDILSLKMSIKNFILNPNNSPDLPKSPHRAVITINSDAGTSYETYVQVYSVIKAAYSEIWHEEALKKYSIVLEKCTVEQKRDIKKRIPLKISEVEKNITSL